MSDAQELRAIAERLCKVATGSEAEIRSALALPAGPLPLGARDFRVTPGPLSVAEVDIKFATPSLTRGALDAALGDAQALPLTGPGAAHVLWYGIAVPGAPARVSVFARFFEPPTAGTVARTILLRIDPAT